MTVKYNIRANVVDIRRYKPQATDRILVDSNVWYWYAYPNTNQAFQPPQPYQFKEYPRYMAKAVAAKTGLFYCGLSLSEIGNLIESVERYIFDPTGGIRNKEYRHNFPTERQKVLRQFQFVWSRVENIAAPIRAVIDQSTISAALTRLATEAVDAYDMYLLEAAQAGITQILTDDGDFVTVAGIQVFTANQNVIEAARSQGKLLNR